MSDLTPPDDPDAFTRAARRWADAAWVRGRHNHALDVLDHTTRLDPANFKLYRKRGLFHFLRPAPTVRDEEQSVVDLRRACELSGWRDDLARWVADVLTRNGDLGRAKEIMRELKEQGHESPGGDGSEGE